MKKIIYLACTSFILFSCGPYKMDPPPPTKVMGYIPVYSTDQNLIRIFADGPRAMRHPGKIYVKGNLIYQNDFGYGIHVIDKSIPSNPKKIGFIQLPGNVEISIKGNTLYGNSYDDLVVLDISDWHTVKEKQRIKHAFMKGNDARNSNYLFVRPPENQVHYECYDPSKGVLIGWKKDSVYNNTCYFYQ